MNWLLSFFGLKEPEPLEEAEVIDKVAELLSESQAPEDLDNLYPPVISEENKEKARQILDVVRKLRNPHKVSKAARESIDQLKSFTPKDQDAIFDVDELTTKVKVSYFTPRGVQLELHSRTKSAAAIEELLLDTQEFLGKYLRIS